MFYTQFVYIHIRNMPQFCVQLRFSVFCCCSVRNYENIMWDILTYENHAMCMLHRQFLRNPKCMACILLPNHTILTCFG